MRLDQRLEIHNFLVGLANVVFGAIMLLLGLRFIFRLFGANPGAPFVDWLYNTTGELLYPFRGIFPTPVIDGGFVFDVTTLVALVIYGLLLALIVYLLDLLFGVKRL